MSTVTFASALNRALADAIATDPDVLVFGEDVGVAGGVFRITDGLAATYGDDRCFDTPLAESGIIGFGVGLCMALLSGMIGVLLNGQPFLTSQWGEFYVPGIGELSVSTPLLFDIGVYLVVIGVVSTILLSLDKSED